MGSYVVAAMYRLIRNKPENAAPRLAAKSKNNELSIDAKPTRLKMFSVVKLTCSVAPSNNIPNIDTNAIMRR